MGKKGKVTKLAKTKDKVEAFASYSIGDPAFAGWWFGTDTDSERVTPYTIMGLSAALRAGMIISGTIATLPLRTYERQGDDRVRIESVFDDPYEGIDGMTIYEWVETILLHEVYWRNAYLWHESLDGDGRPSMYRPLVPDVITKVERVNGRKQFSYNENGETKTVNSDWITHIPGPSVDSLTGFSIMAACRLIFSGAIAGDRAASTTLSRGIRLAGLLTPADGEDIEQTEGEEILKNLRPSVVGRDAAGDIAFVNRSLKLQPWTPTNVESQWHETRTEILGEIGRIFGVPPHLLGDTEKQTSWGTGVAEQNLGLARYTLMPWSSRIEQRLTQRLPKGQFVEFDYKGLLQGTPAEEIKLLVDEKDAGIVDVDEVRKVMNLPPLTNKQKAAMAPPQVIPTAVPPTAVPQEAIA
jgi:HK97 family phage portal protein